MTFDPTYGINIHQDAEACAADYEKKIAKEEAIAADPYETDIPKEHMEPSKEALDYVRKGRLDAETGAEIPPTSKTRTAQVKQFGTISQAYLKGYDCIRWNR